MATLFFSIDVKTSAGLAPQVSAHHHAVVNRAWTESRVFEKRMVKRLGGGKVDIVADQVHQLEGSHAEVPRFFHDLVDGFHGRAAVAQNAQRLVVKGAGDTVDDKARRVFGASRRLADGANERGGFVHGFVGRAVALNDFHQRHQGRGIEKMQPQDPLRMLRARGNRGYGERRCVGGDEGFRAADGVELFENVALQLEYFRGRFNNQSVARKIFKLRRAVQPVKDLLLFFGANLSPFAATFEKGADPAQTGVDELLLDVVQERLKAPLRRHLRDAGAHGAGADNSNCFIVISHTFFCLASGVSRLESKLKTLDSGL